MRARVALIIGVSEYPATARSLLPNLPDVEVSLSDLPKVLQSELHPDYRYKTADITTLVNAKVSLGSISDACNAIKDRNDCDLLVYMTGHGLVDSDGTAWFCTHNFSKNAPGIPLDLLLKKLNSLADKHRVMAVLDFCHAGAILADSAKNNKQKLSIITSASSEQKASASSFFYRVFIEALKGQRADGLPLEWVKDNKIVWPQVASHLNLSMQEAGTQTVQHSNTGSFADLVVNSPLAESAPVVLATNSPRKPQANTHPPQAREFERWRHEGVHFLRDLTTLAQLEHKRHLYPTESVKAITQDLVRQGLAAIVDDPGTGKTCTAYQVAVAFQNGVTTAAGETMRLPVYYADVSTLRIVQDAMSAYLELAPHALLILDNAHQDPELTKNILAGWLQPQEERGLRLLFIADEGPVRQFSELSTAQDAIDPRERMWYDLVRNKHKALGGRQDFTGFCNFYIKLCEPLQEQRTPRFDIHLAYSKFNASVALAMLAMEESIDLRSERIGQVLLDKIHRQKKIDSRLLHTAIKIGIFSYFCSAIIWDAFVDAFSVDIEELRNKKFIKLSSDGKSYTIFLHAIAQIYYDVNWSKQGMEEEMSAGMAQYMGKVGANTDELLNGIRKSNNRYLLREMVHSYLKDIIDYVHHEPSLMKIATVFDCVRQAGWNAAQSIVTQTMSPVDTRTTEKVKHLSRLLHSSESPRATGMYLNVVTTIAPNTLRPPTPPMHSLEANLWQKQLLKLVADTGTSLSDAELICQAVFRSSRPFAAQLMAVAAATNDLYSPYRTEGAPTLARALRFAATAKKIDRDLALKIARREPAEKVGTYMMEMSQTSLQIRRQLVAWNNLDRRFAQDLLRCLLNMPNFLKWYESLFAQDQDLYPITHFLRVVHQVNRASAKRLVALTTDSLQRRYQNDDRLAARGEYLDAIKQIAPESWPSLVSDEIVEQFTNQIYTSNNQVHLIRSLLTLHRVSPTRAELSVVSKGAAHWSKLLGKMEQLKYFGQLVNVIAQILIHNNDHLMDILNGEGVLLNLRDLVGQAKNRHPVELYNILSLFACSQDIAANVSELVLGVIKTVLIPNETVNFKFNKLLDVREKPEVYAAGLRAMALAFPVEMQAYVDSQLSDAAIKHHKAWSYGGSPGALAVLINVAYAVDARLGTAIAKSINDVEEIIQSAPQRINSMLLLRAIAHTNAESALKAARSVFKDQDIVEIVATSADLRELNVTLDGWRDADGETFRNQIVAALKVTKRRHALREELTIRLAEESNLGVIAQILSILLSASVSEAYTQLKELISKSGTWIQEHSFEQNRFPQILSFVATGVRTVKSREAHDGPQLPTGEGAATLRWLRALIEPTCSADGGSWQEHTAVERTLSEVRGINTLLSCLPELHSISQLLESDELIDRIFARFSHVSTINFIQYSKNAMSCALLSFLLGEIQHPRAIQLRQLATQRVVELAPRYRSIARTISLALVGELESIDISTEQGQSIQLWQLGFIDWLRHQHAALHARTLPALSSLIKTHDRSYYVVTNVAQELQYIGNSAKQAFYLFCIKSLEIEVLPKLLHQEVAALTQKLATHQIPSIRKLSSLFDTPNRFARPDYYQVSYLMRILAPQVYSFGLDADQLVSEQAT